MKLNMITGMLGAVLSLSICDCTNAGITSWPLSSTSGGITNGQSGTTFVKTNDSRILFLTNGSNIFAGAFTNQWQMNVDNGVDGVDTIYIGYDQGGRNFVIQLNPSFGDDASKFFINITGDVGFKDDSGNEVGILDGQSPHFYSSGAAGTMTNRGNFTITGGIRTGASNTLSPSAITFPATTVNWTNTTAGNIFVFIDNAGVTGTALKINGVSISSTLVVTGDMIVPLQSGEYFSETYTVGTPTAKIKPY